MTYFYLSSEGTVGLNDFLLDQNIIDITLPNLDRNYQAIDKFSDGCIIDGEGSLKSAQISFNMQFRTKHDSISYANAFNFYRNSIMRYFGVSKNQIIYFNRVNADGTIHRQRIYPFNKSSENYQYGAGISGNVSFTFQMENSYYYDTVANTSNYSVLSTGYESFSVINNGVIPVSPLFSFVPSSNFSSISITLHYGNYGFTLAGTFLLGQTLTFDCATNIITQNGNVVAGIQSAGSIFSIPTGSTLLHITACAGVLTTSFNERYL
jgi:hypothetical protein